MGATLYNWLRRHHPSSVTIVDPRTAVVKLEDAVQGVSGMGAIQLHVSFTFYIAGRGFELRNVGVIQGFGGMILGNEFNSQQNVDISYARREICIDHAEGRFCTGFSVERDGEGDHSYVSAGGDAAMATPAESRSHGGGGVQQPPHSVDASESEGSPPPPVHPLQSAVVQMAYTGRAVRIDSAGTTYVEVGAPSWTRPGQLINIEPLTGEMCPVGPFTVLGPSKQQINERGRVWLALTSTNKAPFTIPQLTPLATLTAADEFEHPTPEYTAQEVLDMVHVDKDLGEAGRQQCLRMLEDTLLAFASKPGFTHAFKQSIPTPELRPPWGTGTREPPRARTPRMNPEKTAALRKVIQQHIEEGLITPSNSPFAATPLLVPKAGHTAEKPAWRLVVDLRNLNALSGKHDQYTLPLLSDNLDRIRGKWFSTIDMLSGFNQCELEPEDGSKQKTAFQTPFGTYQFERLTMGLSGSPAAFQRMMHAVLGDDLTYGFERGRNWAALSYLDDVVVFSDCDTFEEHLEHVKIVLLKFIAAGLTVKAPKMFLGCREVEYLGFLCNAYGTKPNPKRVQPILAFTFSDVSSSLKQARRFLGMIQFYARFIPHLATHASCFYELQEKGVMLKNLAGTLRFRAAFEALRHALVNATLLVRPDFSRPFYVDVDAATQRGCGAVLYQREADGTPSGPIAFWSHRFTDEQRGWGTTECEAYGLVHSLEHWRSYIEHSHTTVAVDHAALIWIFTGTLRNERLARWVLKVQALHVTVVFRPGRHHVVPDAISRLCLTTWGEGGGLLHPNGFDPPWSPPAAAFLTCLHPIRRGTAATTIQACQRGRRAREHLPLTPLVCISIGGCDEPELLTLASS